MLCHAEMAEHFFISKGYASGSHSFMGSGS